MYFNLPLPASGVPESSIGITDLLYHGTKKFAILGATSSG